jgi:hypothetical protein
MVAAPPRESIAQFQKLNRKNLINQRISLPATNVLGILTLDYLTGTWRLFQEHQGVTQNALMKLGHKRAA